MLSIPLRGFLHVLHQRNLISCWMLLSSTMAGITTAAMSARVSSAKLTTSGVAPFVNMPLALSIRADICCPSLFEDFSNGRGAIVLRLCLRSCSNACSFAATSCLGHVLQAHVALAAQVWLQCYALEIYNLGHAIFFYLCPTGLRQCLKTGGLGHGTKHSKHRYQYSK